MIERKRTEKTTAPGGGSIFDGPPDTPINQNVSVSSGPYAEELPVAGTSVGEVRRKFADRFDIDQGSQAIVNGKQVDDATILKGGEALMFVRHAGEKGAQDVIIKGERAMIDGDNLTSMPVADLLQRAGPGLSTGRIIMPRGLKSIQSQGNITLWFWEQPPTIHKFRWIKEDSPTPYGTGAQYRDVRISLPYLIIMAVFTRDSKGMPALALTDECFFRNGPLKSMDDELCYPGLLNCSKWNHQSPEKPLSWICTQHLKRTRQMVSADPGRRFQANFEAVRYCLLETAFNLSSEHHEGNSWYGASRKIDPRIETVEAWEENTSKDPLFILEVPWIKTGFTVATLAERTFKRLNVPVGAPQNSADLARIINNG